MVKTYKLNGFMENVSQANSAVLAYIIY